MVLPFYHSGMGAVQPRGKAFPKVGQHVTITVGEPLELEHITCRCNRPGEDQPAVRSCLSLGEGDAEILGHNRSIL